MELLDDEIHDCKNCKFYKEFGEPCSSQPELKIPACEFCDYRACCISPVLALLPCEEGTILDEIDEGEYVEFEGIIPFNIKTKYCKHMDMETMNCKVYSQRPIACRIAGHDCLSNFWMKTVREQHKRNKDK